MKKLLFILAALMLSWSASAQMELTFDTNLSPGTTITLPLGGNVDVRVDWGDGNYDEYTTAGDKTHTYVEDDEYYLEITGTLDHFGSNASDFDFSKLKRVSSFGDLGLKSLSGAFKNALNLDEVPYSLPITVTDLSSAFAGATIFNSNNLAYWDVSNVTTMAAMFNNASAFNQDIGNWDVSNVDEMLGMFSGATSFNQNLGNWDISNVSDLGAMFSGVTLSHDNYDALLVGWSQRAVKQYGEFSGGNSKYTEKGKIGRDILTGAPNLWEITDGGLLSPMILSFDTSLEPENKSVSLPLKGEVNVVVNWGDGSELQSVYTAGDISHTYPIGGVYHVKIAGTLDWFGSGGESWSNVTKLFKVTSFGDLKLTSLDGAFNGAINLDEVPLTLPTSVTNLNSTFVEAKKFNRDLSGWDVSNVTTMRRMFGFASKFDQDISGWNVSNVTNMNYMFQSAFAFNQNLSTWNISNVTTMLAMFNGVTLSTQNYNSLLIGWAAQAVQNGVVFGGGDSKYTEKGKIGRDILTGAPNNWVITDGGLEPAMILVFDTSLEPENKSVSLPLNGEVNLVVDWGDGSELQSVYTAGDISHTYSIGGIYSVKITGTLDWFGTGLDPCPNIAKLVKVTSFGDLGLKSLEAAFYKAINLVEVPLTLPTTVTNLEWTFADAKKFNQNISSWDVSNVTNMTSMFAGANKFNQDIGGWDVSNVTIMSYMFYSTAFNQDISKWNINKVDDMDGLFEGVTLSTQNYNSLLIGWAAQAVQNGVRFGGGNSKYSAGDAADARFNLRANYSWTITDGGETDESAINSTPAEQFTFYPNPTSGIVNLDLQGKRIQNLKIVDVTGKVISEKSHINSTETVDFSNFSNGLYLVILQSENGTQSFKVVKE